MFYDLDSSTIQGSNLGQLLPLFGIANLSSFAFDGTRELKENMNTNLDQILQWLKGSSQ